MAKMKATRQGRDAIPVGDYLARFTDVEVTESKSSGDPMMKVTLEIDEGEHAGRKVFDNLMLAGKGIFRIQGLMAILRGEGAEFDTEDAADLEEALQGELVKVRIKHEEYKGEMGAKVDFYDSPGKSGEKKLASVPKSDGAGLDDLKF